MPDKDTSLKILFVEDVEADFELAENELRDTINFESLRVENSSDYERALKEFKPDLVISDYSLPQFNGMIALKILKEFNESLPFIILTGTLNEEIAVECMKAGATDYVIKEHIGKLPYAVKEAVRYMEAMNEKLKTEGALLESESRYRSIFEKSRVIMLLVNPDTREIIDANPAAKSYYGFSNDTLPVPIKEISLIDDATISRRIESSLNGNLNHILSKHRMYNGAARDVELFTSPVSYMGKTFLHFIIQDITDRNRAIEDLRASLDEKKQLISEIFHRTKNSMQIMISMFSIQSLFETDDMVKKILKDMEDRVRAMALVHDKLYQKRELSKLDLKEYLAELAESIITGYGIGESKIRISFIMENVDVLIDSAIPCGLVINELVTNVVKHAFPRDMSGTMEISLSKNGTGKIILSVSDDGIGTSDRTGSADTGTMGLQITRNIVEYQLKGTLEQKPKLPHGTEWIITFIDDKYKERI